MGSVPGDEFLGIALTSKFSELEQTEAIKLTLFLACLTFKPKTWKRNVSVMFWIAAIAFAYYQLKQVLFALILTAVTSTRIYYPYVVVIPHCIVAAASYRSYIGGKESPYLTSLTFGFFGWGFGGSITSDFLMGLPITALAHPRIVPCYVLGWLLVWFSPMDVVYQKYTDTGSFFHYLILVLEAVDAATTPMGRISRSARALQNKVTAPIMAGILAGAGGGIIRLVLLQNDTNRSTLVGAIEASCWKTLGYSLLWWLLAVYSCDSNAIDYSKNNCDTYGGSTELRVVLVGFHTVLVLLSDLGYIQGHPFVWTATYLRTSGANMAAYLRLGPPLLSSQKIEKKDKMEKKD